MLGAALAALLAVGVALMIYATTRSKPPAESFHGWRAQHYTDNPYNGQTYRCGRGHSDPHRDRFGDEGHWPH